MALTPAALALAATLLTGSALHEAVRPAFPATRVAAKAIRFTDGILSFEDLSNYSWQSWNQLFPLNARKYAAQVLPDGSVDYLATRDHPSLVTPGSVDSLQSPGMARVAPDAQFAPGTPLYHVRVRQELRAGATERFVGFTVTNYTGTELLSLEFLTEGTALETVSPEKLASGLLPFFPSGTNERTARTSITLLGTEKVSTTIRRESVGGTEYLEVFLSQGLKDSLFMMYREWSSPLEHRFYYHYTSTPRSDPDDWDWAAGTSFEARKIKKPGDLIGSEYFWVNREPTAMSTFQSTFAKVILTPITKNWQQGFGSLAGFMFLPGFQP